MFIYEYVACLLPTINRAGRTPTFSRGGTQPTTHHHIKTSENQIEKWMAIPTEAALLLHHTIKQIELKEGMAKITDGTITHLTNKTRSIDKLDWYRCSWYMCVLISWWQSAWKCVSRALSVIIQRGFQRVNHSRPFAILFWEYACALQQIHWSFPVLLCFRTCTIAPQYICQSKNPGS